MDNLLSVSEASSLLNCSEQYTRKLIRNGKVAAERIGDCWVTTIEAIEDYKSTQDANGYESDHIRKAQTSKKPIALSFFSGAMGLDIGLEKAGIEVILACEVDKWCRKTIAKNKPDIALIGDIRDYSANEIREISGISPSTDIDIVIGGPPCQAFSSAGKRQGFNDERGNVFLTYIDTAIELNPKYIVIENVRGLLSSPLIHRPHEERGKGNDPLSHEEEKGGALAHIIERIRGAGYSVSFELYNSANFGSPQVRERVIIVCSRDGKKAPYLVPTHSQTGEFSLPKWRPLGEAINDLESAEHTHINFPEKRLKYYKMLGAGENWRSLPEEVQKEALGKSFYAGGGKTGFLRRLAWDKPSPTLVTHPAMPATDLAHPEQLRPLSIQEYKRIQEFPDDWEIEGSLLEQYKQVGNAVPSSLGKAVGTLLVSLIKQKSVQEHPHFRYSRYRNTDDSSWEIEFNMRTRKTKAQQQFDLPMLAEA